MEIIRIVGGNRFVFDLTYSEMWQAKHEIDVIEWTEWGKSYLKQKYAEIYNKIPQKVLDEFGEDLASANWEPSDEELESYVEYTLIPKLK